MLEKRLCELVTCSSGVGAEYSECGLGPEMVLQSASFSALLAAMPNSFSHNFNVSNTFQFNKLNALADIIKINLALSEKIQCLVNQKKFFTVLGGDHSCAIGTWSGVASGLKVPFGLIWVDAHLDSHTLESSQSKNIHGMPVATLLGQGTSDLLSICNVIPSINPEHIVLIGIRSYEPQEYALLRSMGVKIIFIDEVKRKGIRNILAYALELLQKKTKYIGMSIDMDAFDPGCAPGVGTPEKNGILFDDFIDAYNVIIKNNENLIGVEVCEFNPKNDIGDKTLLSVIRLLEPILERKSYFYD